MKNKIKTLLNKFGYDLVRYLPATSSNALLKLLLVKNNVDLIIDVGANSGHYGKNIQKIGYSGKILSFEPIKDVYQELKINSLKNKNWETFNFALGSHNDEIEINISENSLSSSFFAIDDNHLTAAPLSRYIKQEKVTIKRLDSIITGEQLISYKSPMLKIDVQGFEMKVIEGAGDLLRKIKLVQLEMSFKPLYKQGPLYKEVILKMASLGFELFNIIPEFIDPDSGELLQADGIFINSTFNKTKV